MDRQRNETRETFRYKKGKRGSGKYLNQESWNLPTLPNLSYERIVPAVIVSLGRDCLRNTLWINFKWTHDLGH